VLWVVLWVVLKDRVVDFVEKVMVFEHVYVSLLRVQSTRSMSLVCFIPIYSMDPSAVIFCIKRTQFCLNAYLVNDNVYVP
jgi:hypothetical protein